MGREIETTDDRFRIIWWCSRQKYEVYYKGKLFKNCYMYSELTPYL